MEVTDLKGLKRLMKGDATSKFEFVEDTQDGDGDVMFSHAFGNDKMDNPGATYNTYKPAQSRQSRNIDEEQRYRDLSSDDSEIRE